MKVTEEAMLLDAAGECLVGILSLPERGPRTAVLTIVGGPQYRAGSHRQFVLLARRLAQAGFAVLRFDVRGMGDSTGAQRTFETIGEDIAAAVDALVRRLPDLDAIVLMGLCDGASAALLYWQDTHDARVRGLCLVNPWLRSEASLARTTIKHYYGRRLFEGSFWTKLCRGEVAASALGDLARNLARWREDSPAPAESFQQRMASAWRGFDGKLLLLLSGNDYTAKEFLEHVRSDARWLGALDRPGLERHDLIEADHTFSRSTSQEAMQVLTVDWIAREFGKPAVHAMPTIAHAE